jgi:hypothetical protein
MHLPLQSEIFKVIAQVPKERNALAPALSRGEREIERELSAEGLDWNVFW